MEKNNYEIVRAEYKPETVKILFIGESRPNSGKFFYLDDSFLYTHTKNAFEKLKSIGKNNFTRKKFQEMGCWLYDVCDKTINKLSKSEKRVGLKKHLDKLDKTICELKPDYIIVVKKSDMKKIVYEHILHTPYKKQYIDNQNVFNLPFPNFGHQNEYENQLYDILKNKIIL